MATSYMQPWDPQFNQRLTVSPTNQFTIQSPIIGHKSKLDRPKSVPASLRTGQQYHDPYQNNRPKTAAPRPDETSQSCGYFLPRYLSSSSGISSDIPKQRHRFKDCGRVSQLEHEGTRKHNLEAHLPVRKSKPMPWQKQLDAPPVPVVVSPGYMMSKSKNKIVMHIKTDDFFTNTEAEDMSQHKSGGCETARSFSPLHQKASPRSGSPVIDTVRSSQDSARSGSPILDALRWRRNTSPLHDSPRGRLSPLTHKVTAPRPQSPTLWPRLPETVSSNRMDPESGSLIQQLQQQIDDLTLYLEEERLNHKDTKRKAAEQLQDQLTALSERHANDLRALEDKHEEEMEELKSDYEKHMAENQKYSDSTTTKMRGEIDFLQGAFESYKSQLHQEMDQKWHKKETELIEKHSSELEAKLTELKQKHSSERAADRALTHKEHQMELAATKKEHRKELDGVMRRFANHAADLQKLAVATERLTELEVEHQQLKTDYDRTCLQLSETARDLSDAKVRLLGYEQQFETKVQEIDDKYKAQIHELMTQNTELRRVYMTKCEQLYEEKAVSEEVRHEQLNSAKDAMKHLIGVRERSLVSLAAGNPRLEARLGIQSRHDKMRPGSAPATEREAEAATITAGNTDAYVARRQRPATSGVTAARRALVLGYSATGSGGGGGFGETRPGTSESGMQESGLGDSMVGTSRGGACADVMTLDGAAFLPHPPDGAD